MKIIHIIPTLKTGGAESFLLALSTHFEKRNIKQVIFTLLNSSDDDLIDQFHNNIKISSDKKKLLALIKEDRNVPIMCWMYSSIFFIEKQKIKYKIRNPILWNIRHSSFTLFQIKQNLGVMIFGIFSQMVNRKIIYCAFAAKKFHEKLFFSKKSSLVIQNGLAKLISFNKISKDKSYLLYVGRYDFLKGPDRLVSICEEYFKTKDSLDLIIAGSGWDENKIPRIIRNRIKLVGNVTDLGELYRNASCFLFTSRSEGYPNGVVEACSFGIPVIAFSAGDSDIILENYDHAKIVKNETEFVSQLKNHREVTNEEKQKQGIIIRKRFNFDSKVDEYINYINLK